MGVNGWRVVWVICVYDCPMTDAEKRHDYTVFRRCLLQENFVQLQNSLYVHHFPTLAVGEATITRLRPLIPQGAQVAFFIVTDKQYGMTKEFFGTKPTKKKPNMPEQIELFYYYLHFKTIGCEQPMLSGIPMVGYRNNG